MLNEEKIKIMNKLAMYEQGEGKKYLPVSKYYRSDYIGLAMIKNFFLVTIGYCLVLAGIAAYFGEYLIDNIHKMNLVSLGVEAILGYVAVLVLFSVLTVQNSLPQVALLHLLTVKIIIFSQENMVRRVSLKKLLKQNKNKGALQPLHLVFW